MTAPTVKIALTPKCAERGCSDQAPVAWMRGGLAVTPSHRHDNQSRGWWTIAQVRTGLSLGFEFRSRAVARRVALRLLQEPVDWNLPKTRLQRAVRANDINLFFLVWEEATAYKVSRTRTRSAQEAQS